MAFRYVLTFLSGMPVAWAQAAAPAGPTEANGTELSLKAAIEKQEYCRGDDEVGFVHLTLGIEIVNSGKGPILIHRQAGIVSGVLIAGSASDLVAGRLSKRMSFLTIFGESYDSRPRKGRELLAPVRPGEPYRQKTTAMVSFLRKDGLDPELGIRPGVHFISIVIAMWPEVGPDPEEMQAALDEPARIWSRPLKSAPLRLEMPRAPVVGQCSP